MPRSTKSCTIRSLSPTLAFRWGNSLRPSMTARAMKGRYVRLKPCVAFQSFLTLVRTTSTLAKSTSTTLNACGLVALLITMWSPVRRRIFDSGTTVSRSPGEAAGARAAAAPVRRQAPGCGGAGTAGAAAGRAPDGWPRGVDVVEHVVAGDSPAGTRARDGVGIESVFVDQTAHHRRQQPVVARLQRSSLQPPAPAPEPAKGQAQESEPAVAAERGSPAPLQEPQPVRVREPQRASGTPAGSAAGAGGAAAAPSASPTTAITVPTSTVSPSCTRISVSTPDAGDGTSVSTLSVDTSNKGSSAATVSPTFLNHWVIVPSVTVSPSCGRVTSAMGGVSSSRVGRVGCGLAAGVSSR